MTEDDKPPAYQHYPKDYETDEHVKLMTLEQEGAYLRLRDLQWLKGSIPDDLSKLATICRTTPQRMEKKIWPGVRPCFTEAGNGRLVDPLLDAQRARLLRHREERSTSGQRGASRRWQSHGSAIKQPKANDSSPSPSSSSGTEGGGGTRGREDDPELAALAREGYDHLAAIAKATGEDPTEVFHRVVTDNGTYPSPPTNRLELLKPARLRIVVARLRDERAQRYPSQPPPPPPGAARGGAAPGRQSVGEKTMGALQRFAARRQGDGRGDESEQVRGDAGEVSGLLPTGTGRPDA